MCVRSLAAASIALAPQVAHDGNATVIATTYHFGGIDLYWQSIGSSLSQSTLESVVPAGTFRQQLTPKADREVASLDKAAASPSPSAGYSGHMQQVSNPTTDNGTRRYTRIAGHDRQKGRTQCQ